MIERRSGSRGRVERFTPSPGTPGEGGGEGSSSAISGLTFRVQKTLTPTLSRSTGRGGNGIREIRLALVVLCLDAGDTVLKLYPYVGPAYLARHASAETARLHVDSATTLAAWVVARSGADGDGTLTVTFVVLPDGLWVADRHSEHVACARGGPVHAAGEMTLAVDPRRRSVEVVYVTNQSTGFCPEPDSWPAVAAALDAVGIAHPGGFSAEMVFRRCPNCAATNIVKDGWFECAVCGGELPRDWNYGRLVRGFPGEASPQ